MPFSVLSLLFNLMSYWEMQLVDLRVNLYLDLNQILGAVLRVPKDLKFSGELQL
jgi:hypothetical protein